MNNQPSDSRSLLIRLLLIATVILVALAYWAGYCCDRAFGCELPAPQQVAHKALAGAFGTLQPWQRKAYKYALAQGAEVDGICKLTFYGPPLFQRGDACAHGYGCSESTAAANKIPGHYYVIVEVQPFRWEVRRIEDTGSKRNDPIARSQCYRYASSLMKRHGFSRSDVVWVDFWAAPPQGTKWCRYAQIRAYKTW